MNTYRNGNYTVIILNDGTKIRKTNEDVFIPKFAENCDVKITDKCNQGCPFCYEGCTSNGKHGDLFKYTRLLESLHPYTELALNGNDMDHPQLDEFLSLLKTKKVFANITINLNQFIKNVDKIENLAKAGLIYGIGISWNSQFYNSLSQFLQDELICRIQGLPNAVIHTINGILSPGDCEILKDKNLKILILGYKNLNRGISYKISNQDTLNLNQTWLKNNLSMMIKSGWFRVISFDNLALDQLDVKSLLKPESWETFYMGDDGGYTFYIDLVKGEFSKNSISNNRFKIGNLNIDEMFNQINY